MIADDQMLRPQAQQGRPDKEKFLVASQWQLIRWKFARHRVAVLSLIILSIFYLLAIFPEFFSPYAADSYDIDYVTAPPQRLHFFDNGQFQLRPFVYGLTATLDAATFRTTYEVDTSQKQPLYFFVKGEPYKLFGLFESDRHLYGVAEGKVFLFGADDRGRDLLSRIIYGSRISLSIGLIGIAISSLIGIIIGGISGYAGGVTDMVIQLSLIHI